MFASKFKRRTFSLFACVAILATMVLGSAGSVFADGPAPSIGVNGSTFSESVNPDNITVSGNTLANTNGTVTLTIPIAVTDLSGNYAGWNVTITSTTFTNSSNDTLAAPKFEGVGTITHTGTGTMIDPSWSGSQMATGTAIPSASVAPTAATLLSDSANYGVGDFVIPANFYIALPTDSHSGTYNSVFTLEITAGP